MRGHKRARPRPGARSRRYTLSTIAALILAAGGGRRYGGPKALARVDGRLLLDRALATAREAGCDPVVVVLGAAAGEVRAAADLAGATVVENPSWRSGMGSSLRAGLAALADAAPDAAVDAAVVLLVDTPGVTAEAVRRVAAAAGPDALRAATYQGRRGHPVLLGRSHWAGVAMLATADVGARPYLLARGAEVVEVPCEDVADGTDLDTPPTAQ